MTTSCALAHEIFMRILMNLSWALMVENIMGMLMEAILAQLLTKIPNPS